MKHRKRITLSVICCLLALVLAALIGLTLWTKHFLGHMGRIDSTVSTLSSAQLQQFDIPTEPNPTNPSVQPTLWQEDSTIPTQAPVAVDDRKTINFLLVGQDRRPGEARSRSDTMILVTVNKSTKRIVLTSFLRDTWVYIPGYYFDRLNIPYWYEGFSLLNETLDYNFGVSAEYNFEVDFSHFEAVIDAAGGVDIMLTGAEARYLNNMDGSWAFTEGNNQLNGTQSLAYSRIRALDNDFGRTNRQRNVIAALVRKAKEMDISALYQLAVGILPMLNTDMTDGEILRCLLEIVPTLSEMEIVSQKIPADGAYEFATFLDKGYVKEVLYLNEKNLQKNLQVLQNTVGTP